MQLLATAVISLGLAFAAPGKAGVVPADSAGSAGTSTDEAPAPGPEDSDAAAGVDGESAASTEAPEPTPVDIPSGPVSTPVNLVVDTSRVAVGGDVIGEHLRAKGTATLEEGGFTATPSGAATTLSVVVSDAGGDDPGFVVVTTLSRGGVVVDDGERARSCQLCTESEVVDLALRELAVLVELARPAEVEDPPIEPPPDDPPPEVPIEAEPGELKAGGKAGIGLAILGGVAVGVGVGLVIRTPTPLEDDPLMVLDTRPPGWVVLGVGAAALITGISLLALDRARARRHTVRAGPVVNPGYAGVHIAARF